MVKSFIASSAAVGVVVWTAAAQSESQGFSSSHRWPAAQRAAQIEFEHALNAVPTPASLRAYHDLLGSEPHIAGTPGDERTIQRMVEAFKAVGVDDVQTHEFWAYLSHPIDAELEIIEREEYALGPGTTGIREFAHPLSVRESPTVHSQPSDADLVIGFNAYSASGDVTAEIVYANYGTKQDFEKLKELGVDCTGKIVLARYGRNFRGYKAKFAEEAGAVGVIIYTDPDDSGYRRGLTYPEGGWANETYIQRGSIVTLDYPGDPLTPGIAATKDALRLNPEEIALPRIPVQPIGYGAAKEIMCRMRGRALSPDLVKEWQGGLPFAYRLEGGGGLKVRLMVKQERAITKSANVIATIRGSKYPDEKIIIGCHHDAWGCGASDPLAGTILVFEAAKSFANLARQGRRPLRTIVFATWGAEEYGIIGSTEFCEAFRDDLARNAIAYINLDMAAMGPNFGSSASPTLKTIIAEVTRDVPHLQSSNAKTIHEQWTGGSGEASFGNLGGGSDHVGFYCHLGIPSCSLGAGGSHGVSYHSNYDNLHWYRKVVGDDYEPAIMLTRVVNLLAARLANAPVVPLDAARYGLDVMLHLQSLAKRAAELSITVDFAEVQRAADEFAAQSVAVSERFQRAVETEQVPESTLCNLNELIRLMERRWLAAHNANSDKPAMQNRRWYANVFAASDPDSGYAAWILPRLRSAIEENDRDAIAAAQAEIREALGGLSADLTQIDAWLGELQITPNSPD